MGWGFPTISEHYALAIRTAMAIYINRTCTCQHTFSQHILSSLTAFYVWERHAHAKEKIKQCGIMGVAVLSVKQPVLFTLVTLADLLPHSLTIRRLYHKRPNETRLTLNNCRISLGLNIQQNILIEKFKRNLVWNSKHVFILQEPDQWLKMSLKISGRFVSVNTFDLISSANIELLVASLIILHWTELLWAINSEGK